MENSNNLFTTILHSKRMHLYYLEMCRVMVKAGRVVYLSAAAKEKLYWNIPIANTTFILLGTGTSISQGAVRMLAEAKVMVGFCGTGGTPLISATEVEWLSPQSEYRPTKYLQAWVKIWFDESKRFEIAQEFQLARLDFIEKSWGKVFQDNNALLKSSASARNLFEEKVEAAKNINQLLAAEAVFTKSIYRKLATHYSLAFKREHSGTDLANQYLNHGNYLAYGLAATCLWVLGIPHGLPVLHGKTRRGALVFDVADLVKDGVILPLAFKSAFSKQTEQEFRNECIQMLRKTKALEWMFKVVKQNCEKP